MATPSSPLTCVIRRLTLVVAVLLPLPIAAQGQRALTIDDLFAIRSVGDPQLSPDGRWIVTAGPSAAGIWQTRTGDLLYFIRGHKSAVRAATFAPDGRRMLTAGADGTMRDYRCDLCGKLPALQKLARARLAVAARGR